MSSSPLPAVGTAVDVVAEQTTLAARCDSARGSEINLVVRNGQTMDVGAVVLLRWRGLRGISHTRAEVVAVEPMPGRATVRWHVELVGPVEVVQRRRTVRAFGAGPVALTPLGSSLAAVHDGTLLDISEQGLRCRVDTSTLRAHDEVAVHVGLGTEVLELRGDVLRVTRRPEGTEIAVGYRTEDPQASRIRRYVHLQQARMRRAGLI
jgi:hypothetical protein